MSTRIGLLVFSDVDLLDLGGPYEVFLTAGRLCERRGEPNPFEVVTIGTSTDPIATYGGMSVVPTHTLADAGQVDVVVIPGAIAIDDVAARPTVQEAVQVLIAGASIVTSVCTGAFLLGDAGVLAGIDWTTHWEDVDELASRIGSDRGRRAPWVDSGAVVTAGGLSNGIAMALHLVERLADRDLALRTAQQIDYPWDPDGGFAGS